MKLVELLGDVNTAQRVTVEFEDGFVYGTAEVLFKALCSDRISKTVGIISVVNDYLKVVIEE